MRRLAISLAASAIVLAAGARAGAQEPDVTCTCEANVVCPPTPVCPQYPAPQYPPSQYPPYQYAPPQYPPPPYPPYQYAPPQYAPPQYAPPQYAPPEPLMPYHPAPQPARLQPPTAPKLNVRYTQKTRPRWGMFGGGVGLFLNAWLVPAISAAAVGYGRLAIPVAGPILLMTDNPHPAGCSECTLLPLLPYVIIDVIAQTAGLAIAVAGLLTTEKIWIYKPAEVTVAPTVTQNFAGLAAVGRF